ncbi:MAG: Rv3235 family protein [Mycobacterium sp.]|nr:Rv3235 family protein [Mycobacterium sp.]
MSFLPNPTHPVAAAAANARPAVTSPIIDCEPPARGASHRPSPHPAQHAATLRPRTPRHPRPAAVAGEVPVPQAAVMFADATLRRVLEVVDRRRPVTQLRGLLAPSLIDMAQTLARVPQTGGAAVLRRIRLRSVGCSGGQEHPVDPAEVEAAEVFAAYTRGPRVRAIAARVELVAGRWQVVALHIG